jgi:phage tail sheath gpL-like
MASLVVTIQTKRTQANLQQVLQVGANEKKVGIIVLITYLREIIAGLSRGNVTVQTGSVDPVKASGTATVVSVAAGNTLTIAGTTLTASATPSGAAQFLSTGSDTVVAAAIAACINANPTLNVLVSATSALGVVTISALESSALGNLITLARVGAPITLSAATLANGAGGVQDVGVTYVNL